MADRFRFLNVGLGVILGFVGTKMLLTDVVHVPTVVSLLVIIGILATSVVASVRFAEGRVTPLGVAPNGAPVGPEET